MYNSTLKKVTAKKYYNFFDNVVYNNEVCHSISYPTKSSSIEEYQDKYGNLLCRRTYKVWEDDKGFHRHSEYFIV